jgi:hypothetical protein
MLLEIEFEGINYGWTGTAWVDRRFIRVSSLLANRLTRVLRSDGIVLPPAIHSGRYVSGVARTGATMDYELTRRNHLLLSVDPARSWRKHSYDWGAIIRRRMPLAGVKSMLVEFKVFSGHVAPRSFEHKFAIRHGGVTISFKGTQIGIDLPLLELSGEKFNPALGWFRSKAGNACTVQRFEIEGQRMLCLLVISPPNRLPEPTYWDWHRRFWPGGLPGSSRRH